MPCQIVVLDGIRHSKGCWCPSHMMTHMQAHANSHMYCAKRAPIVNRVSVETEYTLLQRCLLFHVLSLLHLTSCCMTMVFSLPG